MVAFLGGPGRGARKKTMPFGSGEGRFHLEKADPHAVQSRSGCPTGIDPRILDPI
jgi:hypothetical protein